MRSLPLTFCALLLSLYASAGIGAESRIFAVGSIGPSLRELAPEYERTTGQKIETHASTSGATLKRIRGEAGDMAIISTPMLDELEKSGHIVPGSATVFAKSSAGVAVRKGSTLDVSTLDALRIAIRNARAIALVDPQRGSTLGTRVQAFADKLGVGDELRQKAKLYSGGLAVGEAVAKGDADFGVGFIPELTTIPNIEVVGPLPGEADYTSLATAVILPKAKDRAASQRFIDFLCSPAAQAVLRKMGMQSVP
jgi:molybdate transport system substrate-binding protein